MIDRIKHIILKEFFQLLRDPKMILIFIIAPAVQIFIFSFAVCTDVKKIPTAVYDLDQSIHSRKLIQEFAYSGYFIIKDYIFDDATQNQLINRAKINTVIRINKGFAQEINAKRTAVVQFILDGADANTANIILQYAQQIIARYNQKIIITGISHHLPIAAAQVDLHSRVWFNENLESRIFYIPSIITQIILMLSLLAPSMAVIREKESGTIEQLTVSPISAGEFVIGKLIPYWLIGLADFFIISALAHFVLHEPIQGDLFILFIGTALFLLNMLALGILIATWSYTQQEALLASFFWGLPIVLLSGFIFPIANMPEFVQNLTLINPMRYYLVIIRGIFLKNTNLDILWPYMMKLTIIGATLLIFGIFRMRKTLE